MTNSYRAGRRSGRNRSRAFFTVLLGMVVSAASATQTASRQKSPLIPEPARAEVTPRGQRAVTGIAYGDWQKLCFKAAGASTLCRTTITGKFDTGQTAVRVDLIEREDGGARLQLFLPVGMYLQPGVRLSIDNRSPRHIPYAWCVTNACIAADLADPKMIREMESGHTLVLEVVDSNIVSLATSLPLGRFGSVRKGTPEKIFEQDIDE